MSKDRFDSDDILKRLFEPKPIKVKETLEDLFTERLSSLDIPKTTALNLMGMSVRTLDGILSGEQKKLDYTQLIKLSNFLGIEIEQIATLYMEKIKEIHVLDDDIERTSEKIEFVNEKFNLAELKKVGLIKSLTDYDEIVKSICNYFGLRNIFEYSEPKLNVAFSSGKRAKRNCSVENWMYLAEQTCIELRNPNEYNREGLIEYFPQIRWQSMDIDNGLVNVIKHLFQLGITVVFIPSFPSLHIRGATFEVNDKPCIALTDYVGFYPTLWFTLVHELHHILFDWDDVMSSNYHISQEEQKTMDSKSQVEIEADNFAREFFFSKEKMQDVSSNINNQDYVRQYALSNNIDPSFIYVFYAFDAPYADKYAWGRAKKLSPSTEKLKSKLEYDFEMKSSFGDHIKNIRKRIYN